VGWCREEFALLGQDFSSRGRRTDESLDLLERLWRPGWTESQVSTTRHPGSPWSRHQPRAPIYVGGLSEPALARAARHDGWIGDLYTIEEAARHARRLAELRADAGAEGDFRVITTLTDAFLPEHFARAHEHGVTDVWTMPWAYDHGLEATLAQKLEGIRRFAEDVMVPLAQGPK
jgi:alkanesulfonate monooxygenase SsuD/methylene tetrahydromethanopterin reductase-like flavin-dependent oxidoreductase (luciferase family)